MPTNRPMPLTGDAELPSHPTLGDPLDNYPSRRLRVLVVGWSVLIAWSALLYFGTWDINTPWIGYVVITTTAVSSLVVGWWILHHWNRELIMYEYGFTYREGSEDVPFLYAEVRSVRVLAEQLAYFGGLIRREHYRVDITSRAGDEIRIDSALYSRVERLAQRLTERVNAELRPLIVQRVQSGEGVPFADELTLTNQGLQVAAAAIEDTEADALLPWDDFGGVNVAQRQLMLRTRSGAVWYALPLYEVDNLTLLLTLLREQHEQFQLLTTPANPEPES